MNDVDVLKHVHREVWRDLDKDVDIAVRFGGSRGGSWGAEAWGGGRIETVATA